MTSLTNERLLQDLYAELATIERQQEDTTLPHSDQQLLDQAWETVSRQIDDLEDIMASEVDDWRDAAEYLDEAEEDSRPPSPIEPVRFAPSPPPSVTLQTVIGRDGQLRTRLPDGRWIPAPSISATWRPPPIEIPAHVGPTGCPPPPRPGQVSICNCDSDGRCLYCEEEELERWNSMDDPRTGCDRCSGCHYCQGYGYDGSDEV